jgi:SAM-dependent methyltransferase
VADKPAQQDPAQAAFWDARYRDGVMPWDLGRTPPRLAAYLNANPGRGAGVLVPGCGTGYEVAALASAGYKPDAIDISPIAVAHAQAAIGSYAQWVRQGDFFAEMGVVDALYERAFLCALPRRLWPQYAEAVGQRVRQGGRVFGFFYVAPEAGGPPFAITDERLSGLFSDFTRVEDESVDDMPAFGGKVRWIVWQR